jgi:hypothetical protein
MTRLVSPVLVGALCAALAAGAARADDDATATPAQNQASEEDTLRYVLTGEWLDPEGEFWQPRRGARTEVSLFVGGEASLGELGTFDRIPSIGGTTLTLMGRYYPVDRLAINLGLKGYAGVSGTPAAGTQAETVLSPSAGVRWDLVREGRFTMLIDVVSGPTVFLFADWLGALGAAWAIGGESQMAMAFRYSLGPWTAELRTFAGGRIGTANEIGRPGFDVGPFSALYVGADVGGTWSFLGEGREPPPPERSAHARR